MVWNCKYNPAKQCWHSNCSIFHRDSGNVSCCDCHPNLSGFFAHRKIVPVLRPLFSKHLRSGGFLV